MINEQINQIGACLVNELLCFCLLFSLLYIFAFLTSRIKKIETLASKPYAGRVEKDSEKDCSLVGLRQMIIGLIKVLSILKTSIYSENDNTKNSFYLLISK